MANGYWHARSIEFFRSNVWLEWLRLPGDVLFIAGVVPVVVPIRGKPFGGALQLACGQNPLDRIHDSGEFVGCRNEPRLRESLR